MAWAEISFCNFLLPQWLQCTVSSLRRTSVSKRASQSWQ
jgi:hypothetical protein